LRIETPRYLSWENFKSTVFVRGQQRVHRIANSPRIEIFGDGVTNRIGLLLESPCDTTVPPELSRLTFITTRTLDQDGLCFIEVAASTNALQRHFYHFSIAVAERVIADKRSAVEAIALELQSFANLLEETALLGFERQIGLLGELVFLERLARKVGVDALDAWLGPMGEPHDFRVGVHEFEVKTTVSPHRVHTIQGTEQLVASEGCALYLVSVMLGPSGAGDGFSLAEKVAQLSIQFAATDVRLKQFTTCLEASGFRTEESSHYTRRFAMRRPTGLVPVNDAFPAITRVTIQNVLGSRAPRIDYLQYDVNVEGLEHEDGTVEFDTIVASRP
jgi:hypothetical protein